MCGGSQQTSTSSQQIPPWLENAGQEVVGMASAQAQQPYQAYTGQGVAPMSQLQNNAIAGVNSYSMLPNLQNYMNLTDAAGAVNSAAGATPYNIAASNHFGAATGNLQAAAESPTAMSAANPYTQNAVGALNSASPISGQGTVAPYAQGAAAAGTGPGALSAASPYLATGSQSAAGGIGSYMNPYQSAVMDTIADRGAENLTEKLLPGVNATFTGAGQFGSSRNADFTNRALRDTQREVLAAQSAAGQQGWNTALAASQNDLARQLQAGQTAGALRGQDMGTAVNAQLGAGNLGLQGANTDINKFLGIAGQQGSLANMTGNFANTDANRQLAIAQQQQGLGVSQAGVGANIAGQLNVDANRQLAAANQGTNQGIAAQNMYNTGIDRQYGYGAAQQGQQQQQNAWNYGQWQQQQAYPWQQIQNYSGVLRGSPASSTTTTTAPGANPLNTIIGGGLAIGALRPWSWFADGGPVRRYASGGGVLNQFSDRLDALADRFDDPALQGALALLSSRSSGIDIGALGKTMASAQGRQREKAMLKALADRRPTASSTPGGVLSAGGTGLMRGVRPYWDDEDVVGYAEGGAIRRYEDGGDVLGYFQKAGDWIDKVTGYRPDDDGGALTQRYEAIAGKLPERSPVNTPLLQAAGALLSSKSRNVGGALGEGLMALAGGSDAQRRLAMGEKMMQAQILGALQKEQKAPETVEAFDPATGQKMRMMYNRTTGKYDQPIGGVEQKRGDMPWWVIGNPKEGIDIAPGALQSMTGVKGAEAAAEAWAKLPVEERMARLRSSLHINEQNAAPFTLGPGDIRFGGGAGGGGGTPAMRPPAGQMPPPAASPPPAGAPPAPQGAAPPQQPLMAPQAPSAPQQAGATPRGAIAASPYPPQAMVNVDMNGRPAFEQEYGKEEAKQAASLLDAANNASKTMDNYRAFLALQDQVRTGRAAPTMKEIAGWAESLGIDPQRLGLDKAGPAEAMNSIGRSLTMSLIGAGGFPANNFSDADRKFLEQVKPSLSNTEPGNRMIADLQMRMLQRTIDQASAWRDAREQGKTWQQFQQDWSKFKNANPVFDQDFKEQVRAVANKPGRTEYPYAPVISERKSGQIYQTPNGPLMWTGKKGAEWQAIQ